MVFVAVGDDDAAQLFLALQQVADIGDDQVDAQHLFLGEHQAGIDDDDVVVVLDGHHVLADFAQAAEGDDLEFFFWSSILTLEQLELLRFFGFWLSAITFLVSASSRPGILQHIGLDDPPQAGLVQGGRRVVHGEIDARRPFSAAVPCILLMLLPGKKRHGIAPQRDDHLRLDDFELVVQPGAAVLYLAGQGVAVIRAGGT